MKRITLRLAIALLTFIIGVAAVAFYFIRHVPLAAKVEDSSPAKCFPGLSVKINKADSESASYFPPGVFHSNEWQNQFLVDWYSKQLAAMDEPSFLSLPDHERESYRFLWLRSFHKPIAVRLWRSGDEHFLAVKQLDGAGGYDPGVLITKTNRPVTKSEWDMFSRLLEQSCYWKLPTEEEGDSGEDGAQWILEGVKEGRYHIVDRWSPKSGSYREVGLYMLKLAEIEAGEIY